MHHRFSISRMAFIRVCLFCFFFFSIYFINIYGQDLERSIQGQWTMVSNGDGFLEATLQFDQDHNYTLIRKWPDESVAEVKGGYELDHNKTPATLRMCLGDCSTAGSEWTSMFCITRMAENEMLEIYFSDSGEFPGGFPDDPGSAGMYVFSRIE